MYRNYTTGICRENQTKPYQFYVQTLIVWSDTDDVEHTNWVYDATPQGLHDALNTHRWRGETVYAPDTHIVPDIVQSYFEAINTNNVVN